MEKAIRGSPPIGTGITTETGPAAVNEAAAGRTARPCAGPVFMQNGKELMNTDGR